MDWSADCSPISLGKANIVTEGSQPQPAILAKPTTPPSRSVALAGLRHPAVLIAVAALVLLGWQWLETRSRIGDLEAELAHRLSASDTLAGESRVLAKQNQELLQALTGKVGALDARMAETQSQQMALDAMYQELSKSRDERLVAEVEQTLTLAAQQLAVAGNVEAALIALQSVDARLARAGQSQLLPIRKLVGRDIDRLKALPQADVPGISLKLESVIASVDTMPLAHEQRPKVEPLLKPARSFADLGFWEALGTDFWDEMKQLIRVERMDHPAPALLAPSHAFFLRENIKLRLVNARLSLLQRDGKGFREDLRQARDWLDVYFDNRARTVQTASSTLKSVATVEVGQEVPTLGEALTALRNLKVARDKGPAERGTGK
jgi:uroporphyrin-3 C-methyltransferase